MAKRIVYGGEARKKLKSGVIDPVKVLCIALQNAASVAGIFLTLECAIAETQKVS